MFLSRLDRQSTDVKSNFLSRSSGANRIVLADTANSIIFPGIIFFVSILFLISPSNFLADLTLVLITAILMTLDVVRIRSQMVSAIFTRKSQISQMLVNIFATQMFRHQVCRIVQCANFIDTNVFALYFVLEPKLICFDVSHFANSFS